MLLAILVDRVAHPVLATTYRVILLIPAVIPGPLIFVLWKWLYNFHIGPIDYFLVKLGLFTCRPRRSGWAIRVSRCRRSPSWRCGGAWATTRCSISPAWPRFRKELPEAARVDGANEWNLFWHVTLPRLRPIMLVLVVLRFGTAMAVIDEYLILGGFNRALADLHLDGVHVGHGVPAWRLVPGLCGGDRLDRRGGHAGRRGWSVLGVPIRRLD